ncbi:uncharacterized protein LOC128998749 [Macrosteles quadrilineatus]|uniref:uncharacterized protein LOC128998749 n=1 Tax=Macrosteles quadrilineatus TaxID=74068 RepID=UPI0023E228AE|nr:uncharacterized protein LOC128998749 [Macrosteles quadrilineatus]
MWKYLLMVTMMILPPPWVVDSHSDLFSNVIVVEDAPACFRRFATGRKLADRYLRRTVPTASLRHCEELCAQEEAFLCEGFNFRFDGTGRGRSSCQLTSVPSDHLDPTMDFNADRDYDFFERDRNAPKSCTRPWSGLRPWTQYGSQRLHGVMGGYGGYGVGGYSMRHPSSDECFVRMRPGFRLERSIVVLTVSAPTLYHCETECANEKNFVCNIFSYRYSQGPSLPGDNCQLGERLFRALDLYTDIVPDRDFDIYARNEYGRQGCRPQRPFGSDCFERIRSGLGLHSGMTRLAVRVNSLQECEQACLMSRFFTCRAFSFRYSTPVIGQAQENCRLTDWPVPEMNPMKHLVDEAGCELYHRASYGHGCELDRWPQVQGRPQSIPPVYRPNKYPSYGTAPGNSLYYGDHSGPSGGGKVSTSSQAWYGGRPTGVSGTGAGVYLPPSAYGDTSGLTSRPLDDFCYVSYNYPARLLPKSIHNSLYVTSEAQCRAECTRARMRSIFRCASLSYRGTTCELSAIELRDLRPGYDFVHDRDFWLFSWDFSDARCYVPPSGTPQPLPGAIPPTSETWQRFTVSGRPCRAGTVCSMNFEVGIWTCPVDDVGDWDYCCRSGHHCGYSEGYSYPWCYVGSADKDQWRPCSDHYYPYVGEDRPMHWPVAYLHREGPPNGTFQPSHTGTPRPSLVDAFLQTINNHLNPQQNTSSPDFQVVDLKTEPPPNNVNGSAMTKLWTWGQSKFNSTLTTVDVNNGTSNSNSTSSS